MIRQQRNFNTGSGSGFGGIIGLVLMALVVYLLFSIAAFTVRTLVNGLPFFLGLGLIFAAITYFVNKGILINYFLRLRSDFSTRPLSALLRSIWTVIGSPFVFGWLLGKALLVKKVRETFGDQAQQAENFMRQQQQQRSGTGTLGEERHVGGYREVRRDDGLIIRIPEEDA